MRRIALIFLTALGTVFANPALADWLETVARMLGLSKTPSAQRSINSLASGDIMVVPLAGGEPRELTRGGGYRSPVFLANGDMLALKGSELVRISAAGGVPARVRALPRAHKLLGSHQEDPDLVLFLKDMGTSTVVAVLSLRAGEVVARPHDPDSMDELRLINHLRGDDREYRNGLRLYLQSESRETAGGTHVWTEIYAKAGAAPAARLSRCDGAPCRQPSLSVDGTQVAFIRADR